jgi:CubicO group peptidase (beta-lactamase class C family)
MGDSRLITRRSAGLGLSQLVGATLVAAPCGGLNPCGNPISETKSPLAPAAVERAHTLLKGHLDEQKFMGVALVAQHGKPVFEKSYGWADVEWEVPHIPQSVFRIGSITKQFTAVGILQLAQKGKLKPEDAVTKYVQDLPKSWNAVTLHQLLTHSSGIPNYTSIPAFGRQVVMKPNTPQELVGLVKDQPLEFKPGERWGYSNTNYVLLGMILEEVSGAKYADYLQQHIFEVAEMKSTAYDSTKLILKHRARGYQMATHGMENAPFIDMSVPFAAGGVHSTAQDLVLWDQALNGDQILSKTWRDRMFTGYVVTTVKNSSHGYGWFVSKENGQTQYSHQGGSPGFSTMIARYPDSKTTIVLLSNLSTPDIGKITGELADIVIGKV